MPIGVTLAVFVFGSSATARPVVDETKDLR
jgi:hypothetical protein